LGGQDGSNSNTAAQDAGTAGAAEGAASKDLTNFTEPGATE
jgi:hypothetical protein